MQWRHVIYLLLFPPISLASCRQRAKRIPVTAVRAKASMIWPRVSLRTAPGQCAGGGFS